MRYPGGNLRGRVAYILTIELRISDVNPLISLIADKDLISSVISFSFQIAVIASDIRVAGEGIWGGGFLGLAAAFGLLVALKPTQCRQAHCFIIRFKMAYRNTDLE